MAWVEEEKEKKSHNTLYSQKWMVQEKWNDNEWLARERSDMILEQKKGKEKKKDLSQCMIRDNSNYVWPSSSPFTNGSLESADGIKFMREWRN